MEGSLLKEEQVTGSEKITEIIPEEDIPIANEQVIFTDCDNTYTIGTETSEQETTIITENIQTQTEINKRKIEKDREQKIKKIQTKPCIVKVTQIRPPFKDLTRYREIRPKGTLIEEIPIISKSTKKRGRPRKEKSEKENVIMTDEEIARKLQEYENKIGKREVKRKRQYKEIESDIDEKDAEEEGKKKTREMTRIMKQKQKMNRERRQTITRATQSDIPDTSEQSEISEIGQGMRPDLPGSTEEGIIYIADGGRIKDGSEKQGIIQKDPEEENKE